MHQFYKLKMANGLLTNYIATKNLIASFSSRCSLSKRCNRKPRNCKPKIPYVLLNNGRKLPYIGLGTWGGSKCEVGDAVKDAIEIGYRHIDCAHVYENEEEIGEAIEESIEQGIVKREDLFITSKLWNTFHHPELVRCACETTLNNLKTDYVDLYLVHWPMGFKEGSELFPMDENCQIAASDVHFTETWKEMELLLKDRLCKSIGVSNFNVAQMKELLDNAFTPPVVNQIECHPYFTQNELKAYCESRNVAITAYSPLGAPKRPGSKGNDPVLMDDETIICIADKIDKTPAQILIRYQIQRGNVVIPKSVTKGRLISNFDVFNFELDKQDMRTLDNLNINHRYISFENACSHPLYPFKKDKTTKK